jgi:hypothetical protein
MLSSGKCFYREAEGFWGKRDELKVEDGFAFLGEVVVKWVWRFVAVWNRWKFGEWLELCIFVGFKKLSKLVYPIFLLLGFLCFF